MSPEPLALYINKVRETPRFKMNYFCSYVLVFINSHFSYSLPIQLQN